MDLLTLRFGPEGRMKRMNKLIRIVPHRYLPKVRESVDLVPRTLSPGLNATTKLNAN